jgi:hypothetical protein
LAEFGIDWQTGDGRWDPRGTGWNMHNGAWASMLSGAAGTAMLWYWDGYVHPRNLYPVLAPVRKFADTVDWAKTPFRPIPGIRFEHGLQQPETFSDLTVPATLEWGATPSREYTVRQDGTIQGGPIAMTLGSPRRGNPHELHSQLVWHLDLPQAGKVVARLGQVCSRAKLQITVDGQVRLERELSTGEPGKGPWKSAKYLSQWKVWVSDYDEDLAVELPAGKHDLTFSNTDGDWLQIRSLRLPSYRSSRYPRVDGLALGSSRLILLWVHNPESTWRTELDGRQPHPLKALRAAVPATDGVWRVEWWDTFRGEILRRDRVRAAGGQLLLAIPDFARDVAAKLEQAE